MLAPDISPREPSGLSSPAGVGRGRLQFFAPLLTRKAALCSRIRIKPLIVHSRFAVDADPVSSSLDALLGRNDVTYLARVANNLGLGDIQAVYP